MYREAISQAIVQAMEADPKVLLLGEMVCDPKGVFGTTLEAARRFPGRVIETPVSETMMTGACVGLAMEGWKPIFVHARADFSLLSFEHLINTAAKIPFLHGKPLPFIMRVIVGRGWGQGPVHSQSFHHLLAQVPGLNVRVPAFGETYAAFLERGLGDTHPTILIEPRRLYESDSAVALLAGNADIILQPIGDTLLDALEAACTLGKLGIAADVRPWEDLSRHPRYGLPTLLIDMAPRRPEHSVVAPPFTPQGVSQVMEKAWYPTAEDIVRAACEMLGKPYRAPHGKAREPILAPVGGPF